MPSNQDSSEQKLLKEFPEYGEGILSHCFKTTTLDEDGSELKMTALPIGFAVEWMKIIRNKAFDAGRAQGREEGIDKTITALNEVLSWKTKPEMIVAIIEDVRELVDPPTPEGDK